MAGKIDKLSGLCVITGASSGIGLELTKLAARDGCDLILAAAAADPRIAPALGR